MIDVILLSGAAIIALGGIAPLRRDWVHAAIAMQAIGATLTGAGAIIVLVTGRCAGAQFHSSLVPAFGLDGLSAFFVAMTSVVALMAFVYSFDSLPHNRHSRSLTSLTAAFVLALIGVVTARDPITFLAFWELMTLLPATAILVARPDREARTAVFVYIAITHLAGVGVWTSILVLAQHGAIGATLEPSSARDAVMVAALAGFGAKAGLIPVHTWLIRAHPLAPAHISALMSGVMIKIAVYGLIRVLFEWTAPAPLWIGVALIAVGALSALGGVLYALVQHELKRLLAFSSVENVGIITLALGTSLVLHDRGFDLWAAIAFGAALLHMFNHAAFKSLLFLCAGSFGRAVGDLKFSRLGGLLTRMPRTGWPFLIGCMAIAGIPPLSGFASEWLALQSLAHLTYERSASVSLPAVLAAAALAMTAAVSLFCFVKAAGMTLLGESRSPEAAAAKDQSAARWMPLVLLAAICVILGLVPSLILPTLAALDPIAVAAPAAGISMNFPGTGNLPALALGTLLLVAGTIVFRLTAAGDRQDRTPAWAGGQRTVPEFAGTSAGFTKPLLLVLEIAFRPRRDLLVKEAPGLVREVRYRSYVPHLFDTLIYGPVHRTALLAAAFARRTQTGNVRVYIAYLIGLLVGMLAVVRLGLIG